MHREYNACVHNRTCAANITIIIHGQRETGYGIHYETDENRIFTITYTRDLNSFVSGKRFTNGSISIKVSGIFHDEIIFINTLIKHFRITKEFYLQNFDILEL